MIDMQYSYYSAIPPYSSSCKTPRFNCLLISHFNIEMNIINKHVVILHVNQLINNNIIELKFSFIHKSCLCVYVQGLIEYEMIFYGNCSLGVAEDFIVYCGFCGRRN